MLKKLKSFGSNISPKVDFGELGEEQGNTFHQERWKNNIEENERKM